MVENLSYAGPFKDFGSWNNVCQLIHCCSVQGKYMYIEILLYIKDKVKSLVRKTGSMYMYLN